MNLKLRRVKAGIRGFTLIQLSVLLVVASLAAVAILPSYHATVDTNAVTTARMNTILTALHNYEAANASLPCPADAKQPVSSTTYGVAGANPGPATNCTGGTPAATYVDATNNVAVGMVPLRALGLSNDYALDGYGRTITYAVDTNASALGWVTKSLTGHLLINDNGTSKNGVVALVSHGADGHGAWVPMSGTTGSANRLNAGSADTNQLTNAHLDSSFAPTTTLTNFVKVPRSATFDDIVVYSNPQWDMSTIPSTTQLYITSITPPANAQYLKTQVLTFTVVFNKTVTVTGTPRLTLSATGAGYAIGTGNLAYATYASGTGTNTLTFTYTVTASDNAPSGTTMVASVDVNGGSIANGSANAITGFTAPVLTGVQIVQVYNPQVYVLDQFNNRVEILDLSGNYLSQFGSAGAGNGQIQVSRGGGTCGGYIAIDRNHNIWVSDCYNSRMEEFDYNGNYLSQFHVTSNGNAAGAIAVDSSNNLWLDTGYATSGLAGEVVVEYNTTGTLLQTLHTGDSGTTAGIAFDASGNLWVAGMWENQIQEFKTDGSSTLLYALPTGGTCSSSTPCATGSINGSFNWPTGIAFDTGGNFWVSNNQAGNVAKYQSNGTYLLSVSGLGYPSAAAFDATGNMWVSNTTGNTVNVYSSSGSLLHTYGTAGSGDGQFSWPGSLAIGNR